MTGEPFPCRTGNATNFVRVSKWIRQSSRRWLDIGIIVLLGISCGEESKSGKSRDANNDTTIWDSSVNDSATVLDAPLMPTDGPIGDSAILLDSSIPLFDGLSSDSAIDGSLTDAMEWLGFAQDAYIKASNPGTDDFFGSALAVYGNTLVVGVPLEDSNATGIDGNQSDNSSSSSGAVYVFARTGGTWTQEAYIKASNTGSGDRFGADVALYENTLAVAASFEQSNATGVDGNQVNNSAGLSGAVYIFTRDNGTWTQEAYIKASNTDAGDRFGSSLALEGNTLVVGATGEDSAATGAYGDQNDNEQPNSGAVYVFDRTGSSWSQVAYLKSSNTEEEDRFGASVSLSGDTLAVAALDESSGATGVNGNQLDNSQPKSGAVYVFNRTADTWTQQAYVKASNTDADDTFGQSISLFGNTLAVGAYLEGSSATGINGNQNDNSLEAPGAVYVFTREGTAWSQQVYIKSSNTNANFRFGWSVSLYADKLAVGAWGESSDATGLDGNQSDILMPFSGAVYLFDRSGSSWSQTHYVKASNTNQNDEFGYSVAMTEDMLAVGARSEQSNATGVNGDQTNNTIGSAGAVYVFR